MTSIPAIVACCVAGNKEEVPVELAIVSKIPPQVAESEQTRFMLKQGWIRIYQGKVRDTFDYPGRPDLLMLIASDRVSIFDHVLPALVPRKGEVLTALTHFWLTTVLKDFPHHLVCPINSKPGAQAMPLLFSGLQLSTCKRAMVVRKIEILPFEFIYRAHLGGSVYADYQRNGIVAGQHLPSGIPKWGRLSRPIFTPSTKEKDGHDVNISQQRFRSKAGRRGEETRRIFASAYTKAYAFAAERGILILDTKFEGSADRIADEVLTPDSSRFTTAGDWAAAMREGRDPIFYDKQLVRNWGAKVQTPLGAGIGRLSPKNPEHRAFVQSLTIPADVLEETTARYLQIFSLLTGWDLGKYQREVMRVA